MQIRQMVISDYELALDLWMNTPGMGLNATDDSKTGIEQYLKRNPSTCFVAEEDNSIVGVIMSGHDGRRGYIYHLAVAGSERGQGIGNKLLRAALDALEAEGIHKVALVVFEKNVIGNHFWERNGFSARNDLIYRSKAIHDLEKVDI